MKESDTIETLQKRKSKWDKIVNSLKFVLGAYAFIVLTYLAVQGIVAQQQLATVLHKVEETTDQVRDSQLANQKTGTENHEKTRAYIKCLVTEVLTVPLKDRTTVDLDTCTNTVDKKPETDAKPDTSSVPSPQNPGDQPVSILPAPAQQSDTPKPSEPVAAAPPDPEPTGLRAIPLVDGVLKLLGL